MFSVLILEDDDEQLEDIKMLISDLYPEWDVCTSKSFEEAERLINLGVFGLFLLDVELSEDIREPTGIDFGRMLRSIPRYRHTPVLFFAAMGDGVFEALQDIHCGSFFVKPYSKEKLLETINYVTEQEIDNEYKEALLLRDSSGVYQRIIPDEIEYIESSRKNIIIYTSVSVITIANHSMTRILNKLPEYFIQCHRKYIINKKKFVSYDKSTRIIHLGRASIPVGRKYKNDLERFLRL